MTNQEFLENICLSFKRYLEVGTSRSTAKLKNLHGSIATDLKQKFGQDFTVRSQGIDEDSECTIDGRYYPKRVDITVEKGGHAVAGYSLKFVMRNYLQNSNNYFENMLGETANIRANDIPYFQIFIIFDKVPYYKKAGILTKYDYISPHNLEKYLALSRDDPKNYFHTPDKTLLVIAKLKEKSPGYMFRDENEYADYYLSAIDDGDLLSYMPRESDPFADSVIFNNYEDFIDRTYHIVMGRLKS